MAFGKTAQSHAAMAPARKPAICRPAENTGKHTSDENTTFTTTAATHDANVYGPQAFMIPARRYGYTGVVQAVGPVSIRNGDAKPLPVAMECAMFPASNRNGMAPRARCEKCLW